MININAYDFLKNYSSNQVNQSDIDWLTWLIENDVIEEDSLMRVRECSGKLVIEDILDGLSHIMYTNPEKSEIRELDDKLALVDGIIYSDLPLTSLLYPTLRRYKKVYYSIENPYRKEFLKDETLIYNYRNSYTRLYRLLKVGFPKSLEEKIISELNPVESVLLVRLAKYDLEKATQILSYTPNENLAEEVFKAFYKDNLADKHIHNIRKHYMPEHRSKFAYSQWYYQFLSFIEATLVLGISDSEVKEYTDFINKLNVKDNKPLNECTFVLFLKDRTLLKSYRNIIPQDKDFKKVIVELTLGLEDEILSKYKDRFKLANLDYIFLNIKMNKSWNDGKHLS